jgi:hypothetical protein
MAGGMYWLADHRVHRLQAAARTQELA